MRWYVYNWPNLSAVAFVALAFIMGLWGHAHVDTVTLILIYNFMALLAHQCEEYIMPGGAQIVLNVFYGGKTDYDRYPINAANGALINFTGFVFYGAAIVFSHAIWLGLATVLFGFIELIVHGVPLNIAAKSWYNPGLATSVFLFLPVGIYYITYVSGLGLLSGRTWLGGVVALVVAGLIGLGIPIYGLRNRDTEYPFTSEQLNKFHMVEKFKTRGLV
jgi:hypothetical protein